MCATAAVVAVKGKIWYATSFNTHTQTHDLYPNFTDDDFIISSIFSFIFFSSKSSTLYMLYSLSIHFDHRTNKTRISCFKFWFGKVIFFNTISNSEQFFLSLDQFLHTSAHACTMKILNYKIWINTCVNWILLKTKFSNKNQRLQTHTVLPIRLLVYLIVWSFCVFINNKNTWWFVLLRNNFNRECHKHAIAVRCWLLIFFC